VADLILVQAKEAAASATVRPWAEVVPLGFPLPVKMPKRGYRSTSLRLSETQGRLKPERDSSSDVESKKRMREIQDETDGQSFFARVFPAGHCSLCVSSSAEIYRPWCAQYYGNNGGGTNCGFVSYEQCMMTARGAGAWCVRNPWNVAYGQGRSDRGRRVW